MECMYSEAIIRIVRTTAVIHFRSPSFKIILIYCIMKTANCQDVDSLFIFYFVQIPFIPDFFGLDQNSVI